MPKVTLTHFEASLVMAFLISVVLGVVSRRTDEERLRYGLRCFGYFLLAIFGIAWLMRLGHG